MYCFYSTEFIAVKLYIHKADGGGRQCSRTEKKSYKKVIQE